MDAGEHEANLAFNAGADIVTVLGVAHDETIRGVVRAARRVPFTRSPLEACECRAFFDRWLVSAVRWWNERGDG